MENIKKRKNAEIMKPDIILNFYQTMQEEGLEGASIGKVAKRMGIFPTLIIHYFQNKENLITALVDYLIAGSGRLFKRLSTDPGEGGVLLENLVSIFFSDEWYSMSDIGVDFSVLSLSRRNEQVDQKLRKMYHLAKKQIAAEIRKIKETGGISIKDPDRAAEIIITIYDGYRHFKHFYINDRSAESFRKDMIDAVITMIKNV